MWLRISCAKLTATSHLRVNPKLGPQETCPDGIQIKEIPPGSTWNLIPGIMSSSKSIVTNPLNVHEVALNRTHFQTSSCQHLGDEGTPQFPEVCSVVGVHDGYLQPGTLTASDSVNGGCLTLSNKLWDHGDTVHTQHTCDVLGV